MKGSISIRRGLAAATTLLCTLFVLAGSAVASTAHDLTGAWECCGSGGAATQTWTITSMDKSSGVFSGTGDGGGIKMTITGTASGDSVTLTTDYDGSSYSATFKGTLSSDSLSMSGDWESNSSQKGTWTAKRGSAPDPGDDPEAPKPGGPAGSKVKLVPGDIYVADANANVSTGAIYKVNPESGATTLVHQGAPFAGIRDIAFGPDGDLYVTDKAASAIFKIDLKSGAVTRLTPQFNPLLFNPWEIVYDPTLGDFLVTDFFYSSLLRVDAKSGAVKRVLPNGTVTRAHSLVLAPDETLFATTIGPPSLLRISHAKGDWKASFFKQNLLPAPFGLAIAPTAAGNRFFVADSSPQVQVGGVYSWLDDAKPELVADDAVIGTPAGLGLSSDGKTLYIGSTTGNAGSLIAMNVADHKVKTIAGGFKTPVSIVVAPPKKVTVSVGTGKGGANATPTGVTTTISSPAQPLAATVSVTVNLPGGRLAARASKAVKVKAVRVVVPAGGKAKARVPFKRSLTKQIKAALKAGKKVKAKITVKAVAANGDSRKAVKRVQIKG